MLKLSQKIFGETKFWERKEKY